MLQVKNFPVSETDALNAFLKENPPLKNGIFTYEANITILYDDGSPITQAQRKSLIVTQIGLVEEKLLEAEVNVRLCKEAAEEKNLSGKGAEQVKAILDQKNEVVGEYKNNQKILATLQVMLQDYGDTSTEESS